MRVPRVVRGWASKNAVPIVIVVVAVVGAAAAVKGYMMIKPLTDTSSAFWLELAKAGMQILAVAVLGGLAAAAWKTREQRLAREEVRQLKAKELRSDRKAKLRAELVELVALYNDVKKVRRTLRSLGLDVKLHVPHSGAHHKEGLDVGEMEKAIKRKARKRRERTLDYRGKPKEAATTQVGETELSRDELARLGARVRLTAEQARGFHEQMVLLNTIQLAYEAKLRQFEQADLLGADKPRVVKELGYIESNLNDLVNLWEAYGWLIREGTLLGPVSEWLQDLFRQDEFRPTISKPMRAITEIMNRQLFAPEEEIEATT